MIKVAFRVMHSPGLIVLEDDVFPSADVGTSSEGPGTGQCSFLVEEPSGRPQRDRRPPFWMQDWMQDVDI